MSCDDRTELKQRRSDEPTRAGPCPSFPSLCLGSSVLCKKRVTSSGSCPGKLGGVVMVWVRRSALAVLGTAVESEATADSILKISFDRALPYHHNTITPSPSHVRVVRQRKGRRKQGRKGSLAS